MNFRNKHLHRDYSALKSSSRRSYLSHKTTFSRGWNYRNFFSQRKANEPITTQRNFVQPRLRSGKVGRVSLVIWLAENVVRDRYYTPMTKLFKIRRITNHIENHLAIWQIALVLSLQMQQQLMHTGTQGGSFEEWIWNDSSSNSAQTITWICLRWLWLQLHHAFVNSQPVAFCELCSECVCVNLICHCNTGTCKLQILHIIAHK